MKNDFNKRAGNAQKYIFTLTLIAAMLLSVPVMAGQYIVNSLPVSIRAADHSSDAWDTVYIAGTKLTSAGSGIQFESSDNWILEGQGDTIVYGNSSTNSAHGAKGIGIGGGYGSDNIVIRDLVLLNRPIGIDTLNYSPSDTLSGRTNGIMTGYSCDNILVENCRIEVEAYSSNGINVGRGHTQVFQHIDISHASPGFHNRCQFDACGIKMSGLRSSDITGGATFNARIYDVNIERVSHCGIFGAGYSGMDAIFQVEACSVVVSSKNIMYGPGDGGTCSGRANCYGIQFTNAGPGSYIKHCHITADEGNHGGRGIQLVSADGTADNPVVICSTYVNVHEDADVQFRGTYGYFPCAIKIRQNCYGVDVFDNQFIYVADGSVPWGTTSGSYYCSGEAGLYEHWSSNSPPFNVKFERNLFRAIDRSSGAYIAGFTFDNCTQGPDPSFVFKNNRIESDYTGVKWGGYDGEAHSFTLIGDTIRVVDTSNAQTHTFMAGYLNMGYNTGDNVVQDAVFEGVASDDDIEFPSSNGVADLTLKRTLNIYVRGSNGLPVSGASVTVRNNYNQVVLSGTSSFGGKVSGPVSYLFHSRTQSDSTNFNNFSITVSKDSDNNNGSITVGWDNFKDTLLLPNTIGDGEWQEGDPIDTIPPAPVNDLGAVPNSMYEFTPGWIQADRFDIDTGNGDIVEFRKFVG